MIFPRTTALEACKTIETVLRPHVGRFAVSGDLRMEKSTLSRIEVVVEGISADLATELLAGAGWRRLRAGRGALSFANRDSWPKANVCIARPPAHDMLGLAKPGNFEVLLFLRTGTQLFRDGIQKHLRECGYTFRPDRGLCRGDLCVAWTEEGIFAAAELEPIPPKERYIFQPERFAVEASA